MTRSIRTHTSLLAAVVGFAMTAALSPGAWAADRPTIHGLRVPEGTIVVDGLRTDWERAGADFTANGAAVNAAHLEYVNTDRGVYGGPSDCAFTVWAADDAGCLYLYAEVSDQLLVNEAEDDDIYNGDDFEVFIDANPPNMRFGNTYNENVRQFIFLPAWVGAKHPAGVIWRAEKTPGVRMASRITPAGYAIEVAIPKALFPAWQAHPEADTVGIDVLVNDADAPGLDGAHATIKYAMYLLGAGFHPGSPQALGTLDFLPTKALKPAEPAQSAPTAAETLAALAKSATAPAALAQGVLDLIKDEKAAEVAAAALAHPAEAVRKAGLYLFAKRPELPTPVAALAAVAAPPKDAGAPCGHYDLRTYALMALAQRGKLPARDWFGFYTRLAAAQSLELTYIWCLGVNGDRAVVPDLAKLLYDSNLRVRIKAAISLAQLGDPVAGPALEEMAANDPHSYGRNEAKAALAKLAGKTKP